MATEKIEVFGIEIPSYKELRTVGEHKQYLNWIIQRNSIDGSKESVFGSFDQERFSAKNEIIELKEINDNLDEFETLNESMLLPAFRKEAKKLKTEANAIEWVQI